MLFDKFNVEWSKTCKTKDYLFVGQISKYTKVSFSAVFSTIDSIPHFLDLALRIKHSKELQASVKRQRDDSEVSLKQQNIQTWLQSSPCG